MWVEVFLIGNMIPFTIIAMWGLRTELVVSSQAEECLEEWKNEKKEWD